MNKFVHTYKKRHVTNNVIFISNNKKNIGTQFSEFLMLLLLLFGVLTKNVERYSNVVISFNLPSNICFIKRDPRPIFNYSNKIILLYIFYAYKITLLIP